MKKRTGYVSNSSSSSFAILLPYAFNINETLEANGCHEDDEYYKEIKESLETLVNGSSVYEGDIFYRAWNELTEIIKEYEITSFDVPSDRGTIQPLDSKELMKRIINSGYSI